MKGYEYMHTHEFDIEKVINNLRKNRMIFHSEADFQFALKWAEHTSAGTMKNREKPLVLSGIYKFNWHKYSYFDEERNGTFNYLLVESEK